MATSGPTLLLCFFSNDTEFRQWAQKIHDALIACGQTQTADTGQINLATVLKPTGTNAAAGYEIYRFNDALQATAPLFFKLEYGSGNPSTTPSLWLTVGSGTNGAGTLTGTVTARQQVVPTGVTAGVAKNLYASGANNRIWLAAGIDFTTASQSYLFQIERTKTSAGVDTADGFYLHVQWGTSGILFQTGLWVGGVSSTVAFGPLPPVVSSRTSFGTEVALVPGLYLQGKPFFTTMLGATLADIPGNLVYSVFYLGASHTYMSFSGGLNLNASMTASTFYPQLLWE